MAEWTNAPVLKTGALARAPEVRILPLPFLFQDSSRYNYFMDDIVRQKKIGPLRKIGAPEKEEKKAEPREEAPEKEARPIRSLIKWEALEYEYRPKSPNWFWSAGIISAAVAAAAVLLGNVLFAILVLLAGFSVILFGARRPRKIWFSLTVQGIQIGDRLFPYDNIRSFWIHYDPPYKKILSIELKKIFMPEMLIPLADNDPNVIREHLIKFVKERRHEESFTEILTRLIGF